MKRIILPLEDTTRSLVALQYVKKYYKPNEVEIFALMVDETLDFTAKQEEINRATAELDKKLEVIKSALKGYKFNTIANVGKAGQRIVMCAREHGADLIVMTKSSQPDMLSMVGKTTEYVLVNAPCNVLVVTENRTDAGEYRGLVYKKAESVVNLRGQIGDKQSECLLPSVNVDCIYSIDVTVGKIRFFHTAYNSDTRNWDDPPVGGQEASMDIAAGEKVEILVKAGSVEGKADRIRIVNRGMKQEAVFTYKITAVDKK